MVHGLKKRRRVKRVSHERCNLTVFWEAIDLRTDIRFPAIRTVCHQIVEKSSHIIFFSW